jgi:Arc/MetJ-type ribon-helix-helix transcriptional regulator
MARKKPTIVALDKDQVEWLESKVEEGYSKSGLIRFAVKRLMAEPAPNKEEKVAEKHETAKQKKSVFDRSEKKVDIEKILELLIEMGETNKIPELNNPQIIESGKKMLQEFKNIDSLHPQIAFTLGTFKGEMETLFNQKLQEDLAETES